MQGRMNVFFPLLISLRAIKITITHLALELLVKSISRLKFLSGI